MLIGVGVGDAVGAGVEMMSRADIAKLLPERLDRYVHVDKRRDDWAVNYWPGRYTDDTEHTVAVLKLLCCDRDFDEQTLYEYFHNEWFKVRSWCLPSCVAWCSLLLCVAGSPRLVSAVQ